MNSPAFGVAQTAFSQTLRSPCFALNFSDAEKDSS
jgi:hypothetical protein